MTVRKWSVTFGSVERMIETRRPQLTIPDLADLLTLDPDTLDETQALAVVHAHSQLQARVEAMRLRVVNRYSHLHGDDRSAQDELACVEHVSTAKAGNDLVLAHTLATRLPATFAALGAGTMSYDRATQIARATTVLTPGKSLEVDAALYPLACEKTPRQLGEYLRKIIARVDPRGAADRAEKRKADRRIAVEHDQDEMSWLHAYLSSEDALAIDERLDLIARSIKREGSESRTMNQLRADAMRDLLLGKFSSKVTTHVYVACNATTLLGLDDLPGHLRGYGPVSAKKVREIGWRLKALWFGVLVDDKGYAQRLATKKYKLTALLTEFIQLRDNTCTFPACMKPAQLSDIDHLALRPRRDDRREQLRAAMSLPPPSQTIRTMDRHPRSRWRPHLDLHHHRQELPQPPRTTRPHRRPAGAFLTQATSER
ncbi:MAG: hypothetical protein QOI21_1959 [Actinomycetota bacterium]|jgi:hypothetical protein|nr:hypothetical protein [Actinomycetota bacterium]